MAPPVLSRGTLEVRIKRVYSEAMKRAASKLNGPGLAAMDHEELKRLLPMSALLMDEGGADKWGITPAGGVKKSTSGGAERAQVKVSYDGQHSGKHAEWSTI